MSGCYGCWHLVQYKDSADGKTYSTNCNKPVVRDGMCARHVDCPDCEAKRQLEDHAEERREGSAWSPQPPPMSPIYLNTAMIRAKLDEVLREACRPGINEEHPWYAEGPVAHGDGCRCCLDPDHSQYNRMVDDLATRLAKLLGVNT